MKSFEPKSLCILGRQPALGLAELESLYGPEHLQPLSGACLLDIPAEEINFQRLGGTIKVARLLNVLPTSQWVDVEAYLVDKIPEHLKYVAEGKFTLGLSAYGLGSPAQINQSALRIKKLIRSSGRPVRVVPNKTAALSSAQVLHNRLTHKGAWELLAVANNGQTYLAQTLFVQDIEAYGARDQARPKRDARVGMLPPKLAQIIINLAKPAAGATVLDPFCGSGVVLQEALLMGYGVIGSDVEPRMVGFARQNLAWLVAKFSVPGAKFEILQADATNHKWSAFDSLASETYLGRALGALPDPAKLRAISQDVDTILTKFLRNLAPQLKRGQRASLAVPAWQISAGDFKHLPLLEKLPQLGYNRLSFVHTKPAELIYFREGQIVARELLTLARK